MSLEAARQVADAVLYEGYLLYPYRASAAKNRSRWQFGVLGPPVAGEGAFAEPPDLSMQCLVAPGTSAAVTVHLRFLQLQARTSALSWDEAVEHEITVPLVPLTGTADFPVSVPGGVSSDIFDISSGDAQIVRRRWPLTAVLHTAAEADADLVRLTVAVTNEHAGPVASKEEAVRHSLLGAHLLLEAHDATFVSVQDPPDHAVAAAARCRQRRCWPVLAGSDTVLLGAPIILYDHPQVAAESPGALFDSTEIDEILTLRVMTMTDDEKAEARATDPRAATIVDRCDNLTPADLESLHGTWREPGTEPSTEPGAESVLINGVRVAKGSLVRVQPTRRADAQDIFYAGQIARVTAVLSDLDGATHVAVVLVDDPAADLHDWYGRYLYFAPEELDPC
ncbi:hypothetical protein [Paractinoplanes rishiriensis]|uniref:Uncharacterized protein n=1 Tax=Paractinoplanes rishiriensis TaxID=1050105 RepID=A0A919K6K8_9ACTN|nr:hypothetical protein [Actinoplanes rishiriensis]GIF00590.1 hypothetical protein Ari01nite_80540 [Actinoplanes rishiriensis]